MAGWATFFCFFLFVLVFTALVANAEVEWVRSWEQACIDVIANTTGGFTRQDGSLMERFEDGTTWGITREKCYSHCARDKLRQKFDMAGFVTSVTNWLLPWLALTAQLPFETTSYRSDGLSLILALGSPALITYSLTITICNRAWIRSRFDELLEKCKIVDPDGHHKLPQRIRDARTLLEESQQAPLRVSQIDGWLSSLVVLEQNIKWWSSVQRILSYSRRGWQYSLLAQLSVAALTFALTVVSVFSEDLGNRKVALQLSSGCLWLWLLPVVMGWISVGTQSRQGTIRNALIDAQPRPERAPELLPELGGTVTPSSRLESQPSQINLEEEAAGELLGLLQHGQGDPQPPQQSDVPLQMLAVGEKARSQAQKPRQQQQQQQHPYRLAQTEPAPQEGVPRQPGHLAPDRRSPLEQNAVQHKTKAQQGIQVRSGLTPRPHRFPPPPDSQAKMEDAKCRRNWSEPGAEHDDLESRRAIESVKTAQWSRIECNIGDESREGPIFNFWRVFTWWQAARTIADAFDAYLDAIEEGREPDQSSASDVARACNLLAHDHSSIEAYPAWSDVPTSLWKRLIVAGLAAIWVQWGTTGAAVLIAHETPTRGLGCRSGTYLIYGIAGNASWLLLALSAVVAHGVMLQYQSMHRNDPAVVLRHDNKTLWCKMLIGLTHATGHLGKCMAGVNAAWLIISSMFEYTDFYGSCWCSTVSLTRGSSGYASIYKGPEDLKAAALPSWVGGIVFSASVCFVALGFFWLGSRRKPDNMRLDI